MRGSLYIAVFGACAYVQALHHLIVGTSDGTGLYTLEFNDQSRRTTLLSAAAGGEAPTIVLDSSKHYLFSYHPRYRQLNKFAVGPDYSLVKDNSLDLPAPCNKTVVPTSFHITSSPKSPYIYGSVSTGSCSDLFTVGVSDFKLLQSKSIPGNVHSLAWSPNAENLHVLDSKSSDTAATSIFNYRINFDDSTLEAPAAPDTVANVSNAQQIVTHPSQSRIYLVTKDTNELVVIPTKQGSAVDGATAPKRYKILPSTIEPKDFYTSALTIAASNTTLWTLTQSPWQAVIAAFTLDPKTGDVLDVAARATWTGAGDGFMAPAPMQDGHIIAVSNSPAGKIAFLGLEQDAGAMAEDTAQDDFLKQLPLENAKRDVAASKIKSYGRVDLGIETMAEIVWID